MVHRSSEPPFTNSERAISRQSFLQHTIVNQNRTAVLWRKGFMNPTYPSAICGVYCRLVAAPIPLRAQPSSWEQVNARFEAANPALRADASGLACAPLIGAYLTSAAQLNLSAGREVIQ